MGFGVINQMVQTFRSNRKLLSGRKKSMKQIYEENNFFYVRKKINEKTKNYDPESKRIFLEKFHAKQKKVRARQTFLIVVFFSLIGLIVLFFYSSNLIP